MENINLTMSISKAENGYIVMEMADAKYVIEEEEGNDAFAQLKKLIGELLENKFKKKGDNDEHV